MPAKRQLFPEKLWDLVDQPSSGIHWSPDGKRIEVDRTLLEKYEGTKFRSHNFDSFIRQLHFYGFRKTGNSYYHDKFQKGKPEALLTMKRKYSNSSSSSKKDQIPILSCNNKTEIITSVENKAIDLTSHRTVIEYESPHCRSRISSQGELKSPGKIIKRHNPWFKIEFN